MGRFMKNIAMNRIIRNMDTVTTNLMITNMRIMMGDIRIMNTCIPMLRQDIMNTGIWEKFIILLITEKCLSCLLYTSRCV